MINSIVFLPLLVFIDRQVHRGESQEWNEIFIASINVYCTKIGHYLRLLNDIGVLSEIVGQNSAASQMQ